MIFYHVYCLDRSYLRLTEQEFKSLPADIVLQTIFCFVLVCIGIVGAAGKLKEIEAAAEFRDKSWDSLRNRVSFYTFSTRSLSLKEYRTSSI
ncbi:unnamed protein product [Dicrocoelium dendriticum]|nr:unnamed protein product [Dicrocoelium dendriticum]